MQPDFRSSIASMKFSDFLPQHFDFTARPGSKRQRERLHSGLGIASWPLIVGNRAGG